MIKNGIKIANINSAEIFKINEGRYGEMKYNCVIADSLLLDKVRDSGLKISKMNTTKQIINVKFDYGYKTKKYYIIENEINICKEKIKSLIKLRNNIEDKNDKKYSSIITYINRLKMSLCELQYELDNNCIKKEDLRNKLYNEGFSLNTYKTIKGKSVFDKTINYVFWFRTAGKAKNGADYFIDKKIFKKIDKWQRMGINLPKKNAKLVEMEVYKSLISSAITDYYTCKPKEILVINDLDCYTKEQNIVSVYRDKETGYSKAKHTKARCKNTIWDGMCLLQTENGSTGFRGLRHHMYKTGAFISDFQQYFKDYYGDEYDDAYIIDRYGRKVKVSTIRMITTENAMKWEKFFDDKKEGFEQWSKYVIENGCKFGVCKEDHKSKYGNKQRMSYQILNSLPLEDGDIENLFSDSLDYIKKLQNDDDFFIKHLIMNSNEVNNNELLADLAQTYPTFINSYYFKDNRKAEINRYKEQLKKGKLLTEGDNETIVGNVFLLLEYVTGQLNDYIKDGVISRYIDKTLIKNQCYCRRFKDKEILGAFRSPHNGMNNIMLFENNITELMDKYFYCLGENVIVANMLYTDIQDRGNGLDTDTDFLYMTNDKTVVKACKKAQQYPTIVNNFNNSNKKYNNTMSDLSEIDNGLQASQKAIGTSSNVAQLYLTQYWDLIYSNKNKSVIDINEEDYNYYFLNNCKSSVDYELEQYLLDNVCILSVLAQVAVDSAKRSFEVGDLTPNALNKEIDRLRKFLPKKKPTFWQYSSSAFEFKEIEKKLKNNKYKNVWNKLSDKDKKILIKEEKNNMINSLVDYKCPFNDVLKEIDSVGQANMTNRIRDIDYVELYVGSNHNRKQISKVESLIRDFNNACKFIKIDDEEYNDTYIIMYRELIDVVKNYSISLYSMNSLIYETLKGSSKKFKYNKNIKSKMMNLLYNNNRNKFIKCFKNAKTVHKK